MVQFLVQGSLFQILFMLELMLWFLCDPVGYPPTRCLWGDSRSFMLVDGVANTSLRTVQMVCAWLGLGAGGTVQKGIFIQKF